jgi:hypothetical protein
LTSTDSKSVFNHANPNRWNNICAWILSAYAELVKKRFGATAFGNRILCSKNKYAGLFESLQFQFFECIGYESCYGEVSERLIEPVFKDVFWENDAEENNFTQRNDNVVGPVLYAISDKRDISS